MVGNKVNDTMFWQGAHAENYGKGVRKELGGELSKNQWIKAILDNLPRPGKLRILHVGTGPGFFTIVLTKLGHDVTGIDITEDMIEIAKSNASAESVSCDFRMMNAGELSFDDGTFDLVISRNVTWTLPNLFECYREWRRVLAPSGRIIVFDSNHYINLFDEEQARRMHEFMREELIKGAQEFSEYYDFHVRWSYWEERPMVGTPRPQWDANMLYKLRYVNIRHVELPRDYDDRGTSSKPFMIVADRPGVKEERDYIVNEYWNGVSGCISAKDYWALKDGRATDFVKGRLSFLEKGSRILDIGTGSGVLSVALSMNGYDVVGVDRAYAMIDMAELTAKEFGAHPELRIGDAESLDCEDSSFDAVILRDILWTSFDPDKVISEAVRVLRKGGCLIIIDGNIMRDLHSLDEKERIGKLPEYRRRNLGLGCFDVVDAYYSELPLNDAERPDWDVRALESRGMEVKSVEEIDDPLLYEELRPIANSRFLIVSEKK